MAIIGFHHIAISSPDLERLAGFYQDCFGFERVFDYSWAGVEMIDRMMRVEGTAARVVMLRTGNAFLEIFQFAAPAPQPCDASRRVVDHGFSHLCILVDDAPAECARLASLGLELHCPPIELDLPVRGTYGRDPDGNVIEILEVRDPSHPLDFANRRLAALQALARAGARS
jgi:catechol 2,3-dioxygenase-like lactoylglutathione lyase family enzyme